MSDKCCGTCKHFVEIQSIKGRIGRCSFPVPESVIMKTKRNWQEYDRGTDCPCYEPKPSEPKEPQH